MVHVLSSSILLHYSQVRHKHFRDGDLKLKCTATISTVYWKSNEESVQESQVVSLILLSETYLVLRLVLEISFH